MIQAHGYMKAFFKNKKRFSKGSEQLCHIVEEHDRHDNLRMVSSIFQDLVRYHEAAAHPPEDVMMEERRPSEFDPIAGRPFTEMAPKRSL
ncbi:MAG: hypothetical protein M2R45_01580 [Verrucomicrobia subdivision 3 bacterium]|nr:hypothetical protein [Limisphaerales bacterium]MCS1412733.1 hypothetical protein [Limisphaerales bacterium]